MAESTAHRLSRDVEPLRYDLTLTPDLAAARFSGTAAIDLQVHQRAGTIVLNAAELELGQVSLINGSGARVSGTVSLDAEAELASIALDEILEPGAWTLHLTFDGILNDKLRGFYRSTFTDATGTELVIATTQFEATDARRAFPCWDEPDFKATFLITLIVQDGLTALSNGALAAETNLQDGSRRVEFAETMKMSTYLVAFIVGPFVVSEPIDVDGVPLRVACVPGRESLTPFALEAGAAALTYLSEYFGIAYPGDKLDLVAIPDFAFGAMENLGCVTFRETALLVDPQRASRLEVERVADVIGHEIAHMWFGDLVTMKWWNGIWLNEAFATFMQMSFTDSFRPAWQRWVSFGLAKSAAMNIDSLSSTRPIEFEVVRPAEAQGMFDLLTYQKGGAVLRMLDKYLGAEDFAAGISAYLTEHSYANAETTDLWKALEESSGQPVRAMMDSWIFQGGHPVLRVELSADKSSAVLTQRRFRYQPDAETAADGPLWQVPVGLRVRTAEGFVTEKVLLTGASATVGLPAGTEWLIANEAYNGFYRVQYGAELLAAIERDIALLEPLERFALITDTWALCLAGDLDLAQVVRLLGFMAGDNDPDVWGAMLAPLRLLDKLAGPQERSQFQSFVTELASAKFAELGWSAEPDEDERLATLRGVLINALGVLAADPDVQRQAATRYTAYETDPKALDADLVQPVQATLAAMNDPEQYERLYLKFVDTGSTPQEKVSSLGALARFSASELVKRTLELLLSNQVRSQDAPYSIALMLGQRDSARASWQWCEEHWDELLARFPENSISRMIEGITAQLDPDLVESVTTFLAAHPIPQAQKSIDQTCERLLVNAGFYRRYTATLGEVLTAGSARE